MGVYNQDYMISIFSFFRISILFSIVDVSIYLLINTVGGFPFLHTLSSIIYRLFDSDHFDQCEVISHCSLDLHFSKLVMLSLFSCAYWPSVCPFWRNVSLGLMPIFLLAFFFFFFFFLFSNVSSLCILEVNSLLVSLLANIFS